MGNFKRRSLAIALGVALCGSQPAFSLPLEGLFTVDPTVMGAGYQPPGYYYDPPGTEPPYYYLPPYRGGSYASGSIFVMNGGSAVLVDPLTGRVISPTAAWAQERNVDFRRALTTGSDGGFIAGTFQNFVTTPDEPHFVGATVTNCAGVPFVVDLPGSGGGYCSTPATQAGVLAPFPFFNGSTYSGTNPVSYVTGNAAGTPTFDYDPVSGEFTVDLSSWSVLWNGTVFDQGPSGTGPGGVSYPDAVDASFDPVTKRYSISWGNRIVGGPFNGFQGYWHFEGTYMGDSLGTPAVPPTVEEVFGSNSSGCSLAKSDVSLRTQADWLLVLASLLGLWVWRRPGLGGKAT